MKTEVWMDENGDIGFIGKDFAESSHSVFKKEQLKMEGRWDRFVEEIKTDMEYLGDL